MSLLNLAYVIRMFVQEVLCQISVGQKQPLTCQMKKKVCWISSLLVFMGRKVRGRHFEAHSRGQVTSLEFSMIKYLFLSQDKNGKSYGSRLPCMYARSLKLFQKILSLQRADNLVQIMLDFYQMLF
jgi:hypothetical protein